MSDQSDTPYTYICHQITRKTLFRMMRPMMVEVVELFVLVEVEAGILMRGGRANCNLVPSSEKRKTEKNYVKLSLIV